MHILMKIVILHQLMLQAILHHYILRHLIEKFVEEIRGYAINYFRKILSNLGWDPKNQINILMHYFEHL